MKGDRMATIESPRELFVHKLAVALKMENTILDMLEELQQAANERELKRNLAQHRHETQQQVRNLERAFEALGEEPEEQPSPTIEALAKEVEQNLKQVTDDLNDAVILSSMIETEAHEIAVYDGLITQAEAIDEEDVVALFQENLEQEQAALQQARKATKQLVHAKAHAGAR
jgi:ferritin-like metal-binding protein YciE